MIFSLESKLSTVLKGYVDDPFVKHFVVPKKKPPARTPLINRGYYLRFKAIEWAFDQIKPNLVITLGCGFDTSALRYLDIKFIEIDLPKVARRKLDIIRKDNLMSGLEFNSLSFPFVIFKNSRYGLIAADMRLTDSLSVLITDEITRIASDDDRILILNECCLCYIKQRDSNNLLTTVISSILNSEEIDIKRENLYYAGYEHLRPSQPNCGFSKFMLSHFDAMGSPLKTFITKIEQEERFRTKLSFQDAKVVDMMVFNEQQLESNPAEVKNMSRELFDEYEEFSLLSSCYAILIARYVDILTLIPFN